MVRQAVACQGRYLITNESDSPMEWVQNLCRGPHLKTVELSNLDSRSDLEVCPVQQEVAEESKRVWKFIIDREIEAPDRFQAIQTYRCAHH